MTAPAPARPAHSRPLALPGRSHRRRLRPGAITGILVLTCLSLMLLDVRGGPTDALRSIGRWLGGPVESASSGLFGPVVVEAVRRPDVSGLEEQISQLQQANEGLQADNHALTERLAAAPDEARVERFAATIGRRVVTAKVVAAATAPLASAITIDVGSADGVRPDSAVLVPAGLVGRVTGVGPTASTVQAITDPASATAVRMRASRQVGMAQGGGDAHRLALTFVDPLAEVAVGDAVVTMGSPDSWPFPPGLPVGTVSAVSGAVGDVGRRIEVSPAADLGTLDHVAVLIEPGDAATTGGSP